MAVIGGASMPWALCIGQDAAPQPEAVVGFRYSRAMRGTGIVWDAKGLDDYLRSPQDLIPGNVMPFPGVPDSAERAGLIAYLRSLK